MVVNRLAGFGCILGLQGAVDPSVGAKRVLHEVPTIFMWNAVHHCPKCPAFGHRWPLYVYVRYIAVPLNSFRDLCISDRELS